MQRMLFSESGVWQNGLEQSFGGGSVMSGFSDILGNERIKEYFKRTLERGQISHAYILTGEAGMGRKTLAKAFAMTLLCDQNREGSIGEPCGVCHSCVQFLSDNHPDVIYVTHEKEGVGVDDIREQLNGTALVRPYSSPYKIYIVDDAEKMTVQAQNAGRAAGLCGDLAFDHPIRRFFAYDSFTLYHIEAKASV